MADNTLPIVLLVTVALEVSFAAAGQLWSSLEGRFKHSYKAIVVVV